MRTIKVFAFLLLIMAAAQSAFAGTYFENMLTAHKRGITNIVTGIAEIPMAIQDAHGEGVVGLNYLQAAVVGIGKAAVRILSGLWDVPAGFIPGLQQGMPPDPETLF